MARAIPPECLMAVSILSIQVGAALATTLFDQVGPAAIALLKACFTAAVLGLFTGIWRPGDLRRHAVLLVVFGAVIATMFASSYETLARLPMGVAATVGFLGPLGVAVAHSRRLAHFAWVALALGGVVLLTPALFAPDRPSNVAGLVWAVLSALSWAGFVVASPIVSRRVPGLRGLAAAMTIAALLLIPYAVLEQGAQNVTVVSFGVIFVVAVLTTILPLTLEFTALSRMSPRGYGVLVSTEPAAAAVAGSVLLGQAMSPIEACGIALVCAASLGMTWTDRRA